MLRNLGAFSVGLLVAFVLVATIQNLGMWVVKPSPEVQSQDWEVMKAAIAKLPPQSFLFVLISWSCGSFGGAVSATLIARQSRMLPAVIIGVLLWLATLSMLLMIPGPLFMWSGLLLVPAACAAGIALAVRMIPTQPAGTQPYDMRKKGMACK